MKIAYTSTFNAEDVHSWSGTPLHMSRALKASGMEINYIGLLKRQLPPLFKFKQLWSKYICQQRESPRFNTTAAKHYSAQVMRQLKTLTVDAVVSPLINPIAYLDCKQPIVLWTDAVYAALLGFYPPFAFHSASSIHQGNHMTAQCLARCQLAIFSSDWAARGAIELYGANKDTVKVVPFGANIDAHPSLEEIRYYIQHRAKDKINLLFLAKSWERKGGDIALAVTKALHEAGHAVTLTIVGYEPPHLEAHLPYVNCLGYISKHTPEGKQKIRQLLADTHLLFVPSRAEAYGIVFCEANAFAVPCLTTHVGGINTIIKDHINGMTFGLNTPINSFCDYIIHLMQNRTQYNEMALNAYHEYLSRLNWQCAASTVKQLIQSL